MAVAEQKDAQAAENPLLAGLPVRRRSDPCTFVIFGASGDLTKRKLVPALYSLAARQMLPEHFAVLGVARTEETTDEFRARMHEVFFLLDRNKDGFLTKDEVPRATDAAFRAADKNGDGKLSLDEYIDARMKDFEAADRNKDGVLTRDEVQ